MGDWWTELGLSREVSSEKEIKAAYARLLKLHRPDQDPEGFRRIRAAYEAGMAVLRGKQEAVPPASNAEAVLYRALEIETDRHEAPAAKLAGDPLPAVLARRNASALQKSMAELVEAYGLQGTNADFTWVLNRHSEPTDATWALSEVNAEELMAWLDRDEVERTRVILSAWDHSGDSELTLEFIERLIEKSDVLHSEDAIMLAFELAMWVAFWSEDHAVAMGDALYPKLPTQHRRALMDALDDEIAFGTLMKPMRDDAREVWWKHRRLPHRKWDWASKASVVALDAMADGLEHYFDTLVDWQDRIPESAWDALWKRIQDFQDRVSGERGFFHHDSFWMRSDGHRWLFAAVVGAVLIAVMVGVEIVRQHLVAWWQTLGS